MRDKIAFITGGNRGIGFQIAHDLKEVATVVIGSRKLGEGEAAVKKLRAAGAEADVIEFDVTNAEHHRAAYDYFASRQGRLDILINNAGTSAGPFSAQGAEPRTAEVKMDLLRRIFETNFFGTVALTTTLLPLIRKSPAGRIVNLSSILGSLALHADPKSGVYHAKSFAYDVSKTALNAFTIHLAYDLRDTEIKVNSAHPGWVKTAMGGPGATMELSEGAKTAVALATLPDDGPSGGFFHMGTPVPW
ncbi:MAG TPA: SDR family oxidoreductase [Terracidiphilus sp.]|nr:SDR family oxidoreductase [Terracidiphilus sp.]